MKDYEIKARALVLSYLGLVDNTDKAKKCAMITVNEILSLGFVPNEPSSKKVFDFYYKVKIALQDI